jgi:hypothetical protein
MIRRGARITLEVVLGLLAVVAIFVGVTVWRLSSGPVELPFLTPLLQAALQDLEPGLSLDVGDTVLAWPEEGRTVELRARQVAVRDQNGFPLAVMPWVSVSLSLRALVQGTIAPTAIEVVGARVNLVRGADGRIQLGKRDSPGEAGGAVAGPEPDLTSLLPSILRKLLSRVDPAQPITFLDQVRIVGGRLFFNDRRLRASWVAPSADIEIRRRPSGLSGDVKLDLSLGDRTAGLDLAFLYDRESEVVDLAASVSDLRPDALAAASPELSHLEGLRVALGGKVAVSLETDGTIAAVGFDLTGGPGDLTVAGLFDEPLALTRVQIKGAYAGAVDRLTLEAAALELGSEDRPGPRVVVTGTVDAVHGDLAVEMEARASGVSDGDLALYWPKSLAKSGRKWVLENIVGGRAPEGLLRVALDIPGGVLAETQVRELEGWYDVEDVEVHFLRPMPPATKVRGRATYDQAGMHFDIAGGTLGPLRSKGSTVQISGFDTGREAIDIDLSVDGPVDSALELLDHDRLKLIRGLGFVPADTAGQATSRIRLQFPLIKKLSFDHITLTAMAEMTEVSVKDFVLGQTATKGVLSLEADNKRLHIAGSMELAAVPVILDWTEALTADASPRTLIEAQVPHLDDAGRASLGLDLSSYLQGPVSAQIAARLDRGQQGRVTVRLDLTPARAALPFLHWEKPAGSEGAASFVARIENGVARALDDLAVDTGTLRVRGALALDATGREVAGLDLSELVVNDTSLTGIAVTRQGDGFQISLGGGSLDGAPFLNGDAEAAPDGSAAPEAPAANDDRDAGTPIRLRAPHLETLHFAEGRFLENSRLELDRGPRGVETLHLLGRVPHALWADGETGGQDPAEASKTFSLAYEPYSRDRYRLNITASDMGAVLRALGVSDVVYGGTLEIIGESAGPAITRPIQAHVEAKDYTLIKAPITAKILTVASFTGLVELLNGDGISFDRLTGDLTLEDGIVRTDLLRAYGSALGITAKGEIDLEQSRIKIKGTVVPAYTLNRLLGAIPLLNRILVGGEGEGLLAVTYEVSGSLDDPQVSINPLSALAPGFLRGIFGRFEEGESSDPSTQALRALPPGLER